MLKKNAGLFVGIAILIVLILFGAFHFKNPSSNTTPSELDTMTTVWADYMRGNFMSEYHASEVLRLKDTITGETSDMLLKVQCCGKNSVVWIKLHEPYLIFRKKNVSSDIQAMPLSIDQYEKVTTIDFSKKPHE